MDPTTSKDAINRLQVGLGRLESLIADLAARKTALAQATTDAVAYRDLSKRHNLLRSRVEAAIAGIDRLTDTQAER